jgi:hypothetical protein
LVPIGHQIFPSPLAITNSSIPLLSNKGESPIAQAGRDSVLLSLPEMALSKVKLPQNDRRGLTLFCQTGVKAPSVVA